MAPIARTPRPAQASRRRLGPAPDRRARAAVVASAGPARTMQLQERLCSAFVPSALWRRRTKSEKHVARLAALESRVARRDADHPVDDRGSCGADRTTARRDPVYRLQLLRGVVLP